MSAPDSSKPLVIIRIRVILDLMKKLVAALLILSVNHSLADELPQLSEKPWLGWFAGYEGKKFNFGVGDDGRGALIPLGKGSEPVSSAIWIRIHPVIVEEKPDGRAFSRKVIEDSWEPLSESSNEAETMAYRATVEGGAIYEVHFDIDGDEISCGGRIIEKGELSENSIKLVIRVKVPDYFKYERDKDGFEKKFKRDEIGLLMVGKGKKKFDVFEPVDKEKVNDDAIRSARIEYDGFKGPRLDLESVDPGSFRFWNAQVQPLSEGFSLEWSADPTKDPDGKARFTLTFK